MFTCVLFYSADLCANHDLTLWCLFSKVTSWRKNQMQLIEEGEKRKQGHRKQKNLCQSVQNQPDLVQPSSLGHGNHQHEMDHILMVTHIGLSPPQRDRVNATAGIGT
ncbi:hypothetical protein OIU85_026059 [Salix viminalis]|uniref:Uncharacterized protein n=1 Tax=Salix viminalis TaxID=40686 RepID=A0A9Q0TMQ6_SALVM|nr:hypothetical protein OIU85_026059 [Salix viminalis]